ncbi:hypothetical protein ACJMK2_042443 [Sinanodonta woodiana]|uniref:Protein kinase domain-containing protein n=1 Tax=Sinanodonta woodiana TaxID=1069815 RepID=A0ABD3W7E4_SINWO
MERVLHNEHIWPPLNNENMYEPLPKNQYDYIERPPLPLPRIDDETSPYYAQPWNDTQPIQSDNTEVKRVVDSELTETLNDKTGHTKERISWKTKRFVHGESRQPTDDDNGVHVLERQCYPSGNHTVPKDTDHLVQWFNNSSDRDRETFAITITSSVIPHYDKENNTIGLAKLTRCKCNEIQTLALNKIVDLLFRHRISSCSGYKLLDCADIIWGSFRSNLRHNYIRHVSYVMVLLLSTVYLWGISNTEQWDKEAPNVKATLKRYISGFPNQSLCSVLDESSKSLLWALECFIHCLEDNCLRSSTLQIGEWEQSMLLEENRIIIERNVLKMVYSELIVLSVLLLNLLNRVPASSGYISTLLQKSMTKLQSTKCKLCSLNLRQRLSGKNDKHYQQRRGHLSANLVVTGLIRAIQNIIYNKETHDVMKNILESCVATSSLTKQMLLTELEKLYFNNQDFVRFYGIELLGVESNNLNICRGYIARSLYLARLSLREDVIQKSTNVGHPFWTVMFGKLGEIEVKINCLIPTKHCVIKLFSEDYTSKADRHQTSDNWNTFEALKKLQCSGGHGNIVKLLAYQYFPLPFFFILENQPNTNFLEWLLSHRNKTTWIRSETLIFMIKDIVSAVRFLHMNGILHRDLTTCRCVILDQSLSVKLQQFRLAKIRTVKGDESRFATRWMAPESMLNGTFSQQTDTWMVGLFMWEVLTHGCWPFTEHSDKTTDMIMELVLYRHLKPAQFPCIPDKLYGLILRCLHQDPNSRITLDKLEDELSSIIQADLPQSPGMTGAITPNWSQRKRRYPYILKEQEVRCEKEDFEPEMGIPQCIIRQKSKVPYINLRLSRLNIKTVLPITEEDLISDDQPQIQWRAMVHVSEPVTNGIVPYSDDLKRISGALKLEVKVEINGEKIMKYTYPNGDTLLNLVLRRVYGTNIDKYIEIVLSIAKCVERFHSHGWIVRCITARDICVTEDKKICFLRLGRTAPLVDPNEDWLFEDVFKDRFNWLPLEVILYQTYSRKSDVYTLAMAIYEMFSALDLHLSSPVKNQLGCIPFAVHTKKMIEDVLSCGEVPERPNSCPEWLYEILRKCWYREKIRRLTITELISQIEETWPLHHKMNDEKQTQLSANHDQEDLESTSDVSSNVPLRQFSPNTLLRSFGGPMSLNPLPLPCISSDDYGERVSGILSVSDVNQFTLGRNDSSSDNYPGETDLSDDWLSERTTNISRKAANNTLKTSECSSLSTDQSSSDMNSPVQMRRKRGRDHRRNEPSVSIDSEIGNHYVNQNYTREIQRLEIRSQLLFYSQLMDPLSPSMSSQEDVPIHFENDSESDTSACTLTTHDSQCTSSTDYLIMYSRTPNLSTTSNKDEYSLTRTGVKDGNENNHRNVPTKKRKVPFDKTTSGNCVKMTNKSSASPNFTLQNPSTSHESSISDTSTINGNSDFSLFHAQNCTPSDESAYEMATDNRMYCSERMQINNTGYSSLEDPSDGYLTVIK